MIAYQLITDQYELEGEAYTGYGVAGFINDKKMAEVKDVSSMKEFVVKLVHICNSKEVALEHLMDVTKDYIIE